MDSHTYPIEHFDRMSQLARALKALPAQILAHSYSTESFGSWFLVVRYKGKVSQIVYDGRDSLLSVRRSDDRKPPYQFGAEECIGSGRASISDVTAIEEVCRAITT